MPSHQDSLNRTFGEQAVKLYVCGAYEYGKTIYGYRAV
jgi:hypothetical protein